MPSPFTAPASLNDSSLELKELISLAGALLLSALLDVGRTPVVATIATAIAAAVTLKGLDSPQKAFQSTANEAKKGLQALDPLPMPLP